MKSLPERIIEHNTHEVNRVCWIEEMSELIKVICKEQRNSPKFKKGDLIEELSHVMLACDVIRLKYNISASEIYYIQEDAVNRMENA